jgi:hypothetical protein
MKPTPSQIESAPKHYTVAELAEARQAMSLWCLQAHTRRAEDSARKAVVRTRNIVQRVAQAPASKPAADSKPAPESKSFAPVPNRTESMWLAFWEQHRKAQR